MMEIWRIIVEATTYEVSNLFRVRNRRTGRVLKPQSNGKDVEMVSLRDAGVTLTRSVNKLHKDAFG